MKQPHVISVFRFKSTPNGSGRCKTYLWVMSDGSTKVNQLFLIKGDSEIHGMTKLFTKMGCSLYVVAFALKWSSLNTIHNAVYGSLLKHQSEINKDNL